MRDATEQAVDSVMQSADEFPIDVRLLEIRFTGSGSEYFRIWIVNLLLILLTLSLYYPWAKVRRLRYFHGHTLVDGTPLGFHGNPRKMLRGYLLVGLLFALYSVAGEVSVLAGLIALALIAAIAPALFWSSMRFRLANTSWRGMRFAFSGSVGNAYRAMLPIFVPALVLAAGATAIVNQAKPPMWYLGLLAAVVMVSAVVLPWLLWNLKHYQHSNYGLASLQTKFKATLGSFYGLTFKTVVVSLLMVLAVAVAAAVSLLWTLHGIRTGMYPLDKYVLPWILLAIVAAIIGSTTYLTCGAQNLVWTKTGNMSMRFLSKLRFSRLFLLTLKNWTLMLLTLGLYWPFAAIAKTRMRLEAVSIKTRQDPATLVSLLQASDVEAAGDAAGDVLDIDIGL